MSRKETENFRPQAAKPKNFAQAVAALKCGDVIVFPTETLYGLGADGLNGFAVERVFELKGRDPEKPIPLLVANREMLLTVVKEIPPKALRLMQEYWPGPLTLVLPAHKGIPNPLMSATGGVGVRISSHPIATQLVRALGRPLTATSANPSGKEPARSLAQARDYFRNRVKFYVNGGLLKSKTGSTVIAVNDDSLQIIREGEIPAAEIQQMLRKDKIRL